MQTASDKIGFDIECPQCSHRFTLVTPEQGSRPATKPPSSQTIEETRQWVGTTVKSPADPPIPRPESKPDVTPISGTAIPPIYQGNARGSFSCPYCQSRQPPIWKSEVSTVGWITCVILGCTTCIFFWVGLLIRDKYAVCSACKTRLPRTFS